MPLRRDEVVRFMREGGLTGIREYGDYDGTPFSKTSPALIVAGHEGSGEGGLLPGACAQPG